MQYNRVQLAGNLTRDIDIRYTPSNNAIAHLGLAVNRKYKTNSGEQREETTFVDCEAFGKTAEVMGQYLRKGRPVFIDGRLKLDQWQDQQGNDRSKLKVVIDNFQFVDKPESNDVGGQRSQPATATVPPDGDIPF